MALLAADSALLYLAFVGLLLGSPPATGQFSEPSITEALLRTVFGVVSEGRQEPLDRTNDLLPEYDFIVVGAGTAGCAIAGRLSEVPGWKVLLIEAGRSENFVMDIPIAANMLQFSEANWKYRTVPSDKACLGMSNRQCNYPRGKVMGGSSVLNYMIYTRGHRNDYDNWETMGNPGWGFRDVLPYFLKLEDMKIPKLAADREWHNVGGPVSVTHVSWVTPLHKALVQGGKQLGLKEVDYNGPTQVGVSPLQVTVKDGMRWSSNRAYMKPARNRPNLHVSRESQVTRLIIDPNTREAHGVEFVRNGKRRTVQARREVIVSAGAINSPQLLMLSGVGPRQHLQELGVPVLADLKVGYNLMDHVSAGGVLFLLNDSVTLRMERIVSDRSALVNFMMNRTGPITLPGGCDALAFVALDGNPDGWPDVELLSLSGSLTADPTLRDGFGINNSIFNEVFGPVLEQDSWMPLPMLLRPRSRGRVKLRTRSPLHKPLIYHNYFHDPADLEKLVDGVLLAVKFSKTPAFQRFGAKLHDVPAPACRALEFGSREYWRCHIRHFPFTIYHQSGTCKMGPSSDPSAVVDARLRVHTLGRLRVVDASIMPAIPAAHTNAPTYMIAEKAAAMIKEDHGEAPAG